MLTTQIMLVISALLQSIVEIALILQVAIMLFAPPVLIITIIRPHLHLAYRDAMLLNILTKVIILVLPAMLAV